jgi:hypothetical protein
MAELKLEISDSFSNAVTNIAAAAVFAFTVNSCSNNLDATKEKEKLCYKTLAQSRAWKDGTFSKMNYLESNNTHSGNECFLSEKVTPNI